MMAQKIAIIGIGLIGGSLALALKKGAGGQICITGFDSDPVCGEKALECGAVDRLAAGVAYAVADADVVFLCTPVLQIVSLMEQIGPHLKPGAVITDVGSTKALLQRQLAPFLPADSCFIGGHPMAGREKSGFSAANENLFVDKLYILAPADNASPAAVEMVQKLIGHTGAKIVVMDVDNHDKCAAVISHIPHVAAAALVNLLGRYPRQEQDMLNLAGGGFGDTTRIASSNADMWADICLTNQANIKEGIDELILILESVRQSIGRGDRAALHGYFSQAKLRRDSIIGSL